MNLKSDITAEPDPLAARLSLLVPINNLEPQQREQVVGASETLDIRKKDYIFRQGDRDNFSFSVLEGEAEMYADDQLIKRVVGDKDRIESDERAARSRARARK
jgi:CRP-like cAMP-binding protein